MTKHEKYSCTENSNTHIGAHTHSPAWVLEVNPMASGSERDHEWVFTQEDYTVSIHPLWVVFVRRPSKSHLSPAILTKRLLLTRYWDAKYRCQSDPVPIVFDWICADFLLFPDSFTDRSKRFINSVFCEQLSLFSSNVPPISIPDHAGVKMKLQWSEWLLMSRRKSKILREKFCCFIVQHMKNTKRLYSTKLGGS